MSAEKRINERGEPRKGNFYFGEKEGEEPHNKGDSIPKGYKFNPYRVGSPKKVVFKLAEEFDTLNEQAEE